MIKNKRFKERGIFVGLFYMDMHLNRYDTFIQNFKAKAIWWAIMDRKCIGEDLQFDCTVKRIH